MWWGTCARLRSVRDVRTADRARRPNLAADRRSQAERGCANTISLWSHGGYFQVRTLSRRWRWARPTMLRSIGRSRASSPGFGFGRMLLFLDEDKESSMKFMWPALVGLLTVASYSGAQQPAGTSPSEASPSQASPSLSQPKSRACKKEVRELCGRRPKGELQSCLKDGIDLKKFSAPCTSEIAKSPNPG